MPDVSFIVYTDLHVDIMPDATARMQVMLREAKEQQVDFIVHLGDIMYPEKAYLAEYAPESLRLRENAWFVCDRDDEKDAIRKMIEESGLESFGVLGNHDMDTCTKETACRYFGLPNRYYVFDRGGVRFLALDTNFMMDEDGLVDLAHCNYRNRKQMELCWLDPVQLDWLEAQIMDAPYPCVLLSHAPLGDGTASSVHNAEAVYRIIRHTNADRRRVVLAMNGHAHIDGVHMREAVPFVDVNSMSNLWLGHQYDTVRYSETIHRTYPHLCGCAPYWDALFARVTISDERIQIVGRTSSFVGPSPLALGVPSGKTFHSPSASIASRTFSL